jgi:hypothetical protein
MEMHEHHDEELILELLDDPALTEVDIAARLDGCEQCIADISEQRAIATALADLERPSLTGTERAALRSGVFAEIEPAPVISLSPRRAWDWTRLGTVAAALVGVVAVGGLFSMVGGDTDDSAETLDATVAANEADIDTDALALEAAPSADLAGADDDAFDESAEEMLGDGAATLAAPSELVVDLGSVDLQGFADGLDRVRNQVGDQTESSGVLQRDADNVEVACVAQLSDRGSVRAIVTALVDGLDVEVYLDNAGGEVAYASADCSLYDLP